MQGDENLWSQNVLCEFSLFFHKTGGQKLRWLQGKSVLRHLKSIVYSAGFLKGHVHM